MSKQSDSLRRIAEEQCGIAPQYTKDTIYWRAAETIDSLQKALEALYVNIETYTQTNNLGEAHQNIPSMRMARDALEKARHG